VRPILVVVAVPDSRRRLVEILVQGGYTVAEADSGEVALRLARSVSLELILMAIVMPDVNGLEIASRLRQSLNSQSPPIILLGSVPPIGIDDEPLASLISGYLNINASSGDLLATVRAHLGTNHQ
jgi:CheY-like chemotaxis protein